VEIKGISVYDHQDSINSDGHSMHNIKRQSINTGIARLAECESMRIQ